MNKGSKVLFLVSLVIITGIGVGQTTKQLTNKLKRNRTQIALTEQALVETQSQKRATLKTVRTFEKQILIREEILVSMEDDLINLENDIESAQLEIAGITSELDRIKSEFSEAVVAGYKNNRKVSKLHFVFMSQSFNDLIRRLKYLERIIEFRQLQLDLITQKKAENSVKINSLLAKKQQLAETLLEKEEESIKLQKDKESYQNLIADLKGREESLQTEIERRKRLAKQLEKEISKQIAIDKNQTLSSEPPVFSGFRKGSLPWPVKSGYVSERFGRHKHEDLKNITTQNNGIDIVCNTKETVYPISEGTVSAVIEVPGMQTTVLVKHEDHYSVYANLVDVSCVGGQKVNPENSIGAVGKNEEGVSEMHFEIWNGTSKLNPESWLVPR